GATAKAPMPYVVPTTNEWDGNDGSWSTFRIGVGTPPEDFRVLVSTKGYQTWVPHADGCTKPNDVSNCAFLRGSEHFRTASSVGFQSNESSTWEAIREQDLDLETSLGYGGQGQYGYDTVYLGASQETDTISLDRQIVAGLKDKDYFLGVLGLSRTSSKFSGKSVPSIFQNLKEKNIIPSWSYGYTAGASYQTNKVPGSLILGGYDQTRLEPTKFNFTFTSTGDENDYSKSLSVSVQSIEVSNTLSGSSEKLTASSHVSIIDTTVAQLWLPVDICSKFESAFGIAYDATTGLYTINETTRTTLKTINPTITIALADPSGPTNDDGSSTTASIQLPFAAFDLQASWPYYENPTYYFPIRRAANDSQYTLGRTLLQEAYLIVDAERRNFSLAQAKFPNPLPDPDIVAIHAPPGGDGKPDSAQPTSSPLSKNPAKIGVAVGAAAGAVVILGLLWLWWRRRHRS
ncbi:aspartic peptidase domain-containing protein, partial [Phyllosticta citrichinensis]